VVQVDAPLQLTLCLISVVVEEELVLLGALMQGDPSLAPSRFEQSFLALKRRRLRQPTLMD